MAAIIEEVFSDMAASVGRSLQPPAPPVDVLPPREGRRLAGTGTVAPFQRPAAQLPLKPAPPNLPAVPNTGKSACLAQPIKAKLIFFT